MAPPHPLVIILILQKTAGNSTSSEDLGSSQFKENNVYLNGQQSEGSACGLLHQAGHGNFVGVYHHPAQVGTAGTVHPLLQQSQTMVGAVDMSSPSRSTLQSASNTPSICYRRRTVYPPPSAVAANGMKYPLPQYKPGTNAANSAHYVMPAAYGAYCSSPSVGYNPNSAENCWKFDL
ncbi:hypothetical protein RYX36_009496 [Vicia faba]